MLALHLFETDDEHQKISDAFRSSSVPDHFHYAKRNCHFTKKLLTLSDFQWCHAILFVILYVTQISDSNSDQNSGKSNKMCLVRSHLVASD